MNLFANVRTILLLKDTGIKAMNCIAKGNTAKEPKKRGDDYAHETNGSPRHVFKARFNLYIRGVGINREQEFKPS